ncbi:MAG: hypothetical protein V4479_09410 [Actinomycetota bacterium]
MYNRRYDLSELSDRQEAKIEGVPHLEIFRSTSNQGEIRVSCQCAIGVDHSYADGTKYLGPNAAAFRRTSALGAN